MAYREPEAQVYLITGCGLDKAHTHTYRFSSRTAQANFFISKSPSQWHFTELSEIRLYDGYMRLRGNANLMYLADYVMFKNVPEGDSDGSGRWFYAFVDSVTYINDATCQINYTIDWVQTYMIDVTSNQNYAFCVREHSATDSIYANTERENVGYGDTYLQTPVSGWANIGVECKLDSDGLFVNWLPVVAVPHKDLNENSIVENIYNGIPDTVAYYPCVGMNTLRAFVDSLSTDATQSVVDMFMYPRYLAEKEMLKEAARYVQTVPLAGKSYNPWGIYGFTPKNKKLYTYPYTLITVSGANQGGREFRNEWFERSLDTATFRIYGSMMQSPQFICLPVDYAGYKNADQNHLNENFQECVTIQGAPKVPWITDQYKAWLAQRQSQLSLQNVLMERQQALAAPTAAYNAIASMASLNPLGMINGAKSSLEGYYNTQIDLLSQQAQLQDAKNVPVTASNVGASNIYYSCGEYGFRAMYTHIPVEYARLVDQYFTMYGYAQNKLKKPNFFARPHFCYLKYVGYSTANINSMPDSARTQWTNVLSNGITMWNSNTTIGNYGVDNTV